MKNKLIDILVYLFKRYPNLDELSKTRLVKLIYLIDWKNCLSNDQQMTQINWRFDHYGPFVEDVMKSIHDRNDIFNVEQYINAYGGNSTRIKVINSNFSSALNTNEKTVVDFIIDKTASLNFNELIKLVYSTYPIKTNPRYSDLDLKSNAEQYKLIKSLAQ